MEHAIVFKDRITLEERKNKYGSNPEPETVDSRVVWACVNLPSLYTKSRAESMGLKVDLVMHLYRKDFLSGNYTHLLFNGERYKVESVTASINDLFVKLTVSRM